MTGAWDKLEYLREHPEVADSPGYKLKKLQRVGDPYAWFLLLIDQPQLAPPEEWWSHLRQRGDLPWGRLLAAQPQFEEYCNWETVSRLELVELALLAPELFAHKFPNVRWRDLCAFLTVPEWRHLLMDVPDADKRLDMKTVSKKLSSNDWLCILAEQPSLEKYVDWSQIAGRPSPYWSYLLCRQPQFAEHCAWPLLEAWQIRQILVRQPQFADKRR